LFAITVVSLIKISGSNERIASHIDTAPV